MADEGFLTRWSRRKADARQGVAPAPEPEMERAPEPELVAITPAPATMPAPAHVPALAREDGAAEPCLPTMDDVAQLTPDSDFSSFVARGVDQAVRRSALKKLFADPHFNTMDRLDVYIDDYTQPSPVSDAMLASLKHAKSLFQRIIEDDDEADVAADADVAAGAVADLGQPAALAPPDALPSSQDATITPTIPITPETETR